MFHINPLTGAVGECKATTSCPFGDLKSEHHKTLKEAQNFYEKTMENYTLLSIGKSHEIKLPHKEKVSKALEEITEELPHGVQKNILKTFTRDFNGATRAMDYELLFSLPEHLQKLSKNSNGVIPPMVKPLKMLHDLYFQYLEDCTNIKSIEGEIKILERGLDSPDSSINNDAILLKLEKLKKSLYNNKGYRRDSLNEINKKLEKTLTSIKKLEVDGDAIDSKSFRGDELPSHDSIIRDSLMDGVTSKDFKESMKVVKKNAKNLSEILTVNERILVEQSIYDGDGVDVGGGFVSLGSGADSTVYLHKESQVVYKHFHSNSISEKMLGIKNGLGISAYEEFRNRYENLNHEILAEYGVKYLPTYFLKGVNSHGTVGEYMVQPYLDPNVYYETSLYSIPHHAQKEIGVEDLNSSNAVRHIKTGELFIIDGIIIN